MSGLLHSLTCESMHTDSIKQSYVHSHHLHGHIYAIQTLISGDRGGEPALPGGPTAALLAVKGAATVPTTPQHQTLVIAQLLHPARTLSAAAAVVSTPVIEHTRA